MSDARFEPGWLLRTCHDAHIRSMCDHNPSFFKNSGFVAPEVSDSDIRELYEMMNARFEAWTGKPLRAFQ